MFLSRASAVWLETLGPQWRLHNLLMGLSLGNLGQHHWKYQCTKMQLATIGYNWLDCPCYSHSCSCSSPGKNLVTFDSLSCCCFFLGNFIGFTHTHSHFVGITVLVRLQTAITPLFPGSCGASYQPSSVKHLIYSYLTDPDSIETPTHRNRHILSRKSGLWKAVNICRSTRIWNRNGVHATTKTNKLRTHTQNHTCIYDSSRRVSAHVERERQECAMMR